MGNEPGRLRHRLALALVAAVLVGVGGVVGILANAGTHTKERTVTATAAQTATAPVDPHVAAGAHDFVQFACSQCHGDRGRGGVAPAVPALTSVAKALTPAELRSIIDHGLGVYSYLAHLSKFTVEEGAMVERGQRIALSGATGRVTGPHLHWTMRMGTARVDPLSVIALAK